MAESFDRHQRMLIIVLAGYFLLNLLVRLMLPGSLELDEAEQAFLSQWLLAGYNSQPPFYNWLQYGVISVFGLSLTTLSALKNAMLFASYILYFMAARQVLKSRDLAVIATLSLLTIPQVSFEAQRDLTHTVATIFTASLFLYAFFRTLKGPSPFSYALLGFSVGLGVISKYNFVLLPSAAIVAVFADRELRGRLFDWRMLLSIGFAIAVVAPHFLWLVENLEMATERTLEKLTGASDMALLAQIGGGLFSIVTAVIGFSALTVLAFGLLFREGLQTVWNATNSQTRLVLRIVLLELAAIGLMVLFAGVEDVRDRWLTPLLLVIPLYACMKIDAAGIASRAHLRGMWGIAIAVMIIVPSILFWRVAAAGLTGSYQYQNVPFAGIAQTIRAEVSPHPALIVANDIHLGGNLRLQMPSVDVVVPVYSSPKVSYSWPGDRPIVFVWRLKGGEPPGTFESQFADWLDAHGLSDSAPEIRTASLPYRYGRQGDVYAFSYAWIYPPRTTGLQTIGKLTELAMKHFSWAS